MARHSWYNGYNDTNSRDDGQSARSRRNSSNTTVLTSQKALFANERSAAETTADRLYRNTEQSAWNTYLTGVQSANTTYLGSIKTAGNTYKTASDAADTAYLAASVTAYTSFQEAGKALDTAFYTAVANANDANFTTTAYFTTTGTNGNLPFQKTVNTEPSGSLFGEVFVMPWNPAANLNFWDNLKMYGRMGEKAAIGTASGVAGGAATFYYTLKQPHPSNG